MRHRTLIIAGSIVTLVVAAYFIVPRIPGTLRKGKDGMSCWGTGVIRYYYADAPEQPMLVEYYYGSRMSRSEWFKPDGTPVFQTDWGPGMEGWGVYLRDDGSISQKIYYVNGASPVDAPTTRHYTPDGREVTREEYLAGEESNWGTGGPRLRRKMTRTVQSAR
ncbi:MAG: hypothetical protein HEQ23_04100 [Tepidisphaera sp.]